MFHNSLPLTEKGKQLWSERFLQIHVYHETMGSYFHNILQVYLPLMIANSLMQYIMLVAKMLNSGLNSKIYGKNLLPKFTQS